MAEKECYELTLTPNYVSDWNFNNAIREIIQNGTDQQILDPNNKFSITYDKEKQTLYLKNETSKLNVNTLLLGRSSKAKNEDTVGQFGEGYKIAALVFNRLGKGFTIHNNEANELWESKFKNSAKWHDKLLAFYVSENKTSEKGLVIEITGVTQEEYEGMDGVWVGMFEDGYEKADTDYGEIILDEMFAGEVYVNGLSVECNSNLQYGYNFKPKYIRLERDRKTCDSWNVGDITSLMIAQAMVNGDIKIETVRTMVEKNVDDVYHFEFNRYNNNVEKVSEALIAAFDEQNKAPYSVPVSSQEEIQKVKAYGGNPVIVPPKVYSLLKKDTEKRIRELASLPVSNELTLRERFLRWKNIYSSDLSEDAKNELRVLIDELD